jgi:ribosome-associated translation inhibitor RaiA
MKLLLRYCGLNARAVWRGLVESQIQKLQGLASIASARVTLEWQREFAPAFRVRAQLEIPGPDLHAEARDHTLPAALLKVARELERQIRSRQSRRAGRRKTNLQLGLMPGHGPMRLGCGNA